MRPISVPAFLTESPEGSEIAVRQQPVYCIIAGTVSPLRRSLQIAHALPVTAIGAVSYTDTENWSFLDSFPMTAATPGTVGESNARDNAPVVIGTRAQLQTSEVSTQVE